MNDSTTGSCVAVTERSPMPHRPTGMYQRARRSFHALLLQVAVLLVAACSGSAGGLPAGSPPASTAAEPVTTPEAAIARIVAMEPRLAGIAARDADTIGATSWYVATPSDDGFDVEVYVGWGDCMAGCIDHHAWRFAVARDGTVTLVGEEGEPVPDAEWPSPGGTGRTGIFGMALAGPVCPVEQPGDPTCEPRPVTGATVRVADAAGDEVATAVTDDAGRFFVELGPGTYTVLAEPVEGLMGAPAALTAEVGTGEAVVTLSYDTGIR